MNDMPAISTMIPPHLSMDEYVDFIEASIKEANPVFAARQKNIEEQITHPFQLLFNSQNIHDNLRVAPQK